jgi:hypothetical protein
MPDALMPCPVRASITGKRLWGQILIEENLVHLPGHHQLRLQPLDATLRGGQL